MNTGVAFIILAEVAVFLFVIYGFMHEEKFIALEDKVINNIRRSRRAKAAAQRRRINEKVCYTPERPARRTSSGSKVA